MRFRGRSTWGRKGDRTLSSGDPEGWFTSQVQGRHLKPRELGWHLYQSTERIPFVEALMGLPTEEEALGGTVTPMTRATHVTNSTNQCFFLTVTDATVQVVYGGIVRTPSRIATTVGCPHGRPTPNGKRHPGA